MRPVTYVGALVLPIALAGYHATAQPFIPNPQATDSGFFGWSIAPAGDKLIVGAVNNIADGKGAGVAYVLDSASGSVLRAIPNPNPIQGDQFGDAIDAAENRILIGDQVHQSAYLFDISNGALLKTFLDPTYGVGNGNYFGRAVALAGETVLVSSPRTDNNSAVHQFDIASGNPLRTYTQPGPPYDTEFGRAIAAADGKMLVGSRGGDPTAAVHLFDTNSGQLLRTIPSPNSVANEFFGNYLDLTDRWAVVASTRSTNGSGSVYIFDISTGALLRTLTSPTPQFSDEFGRSIFAMGDYVLVGAKRSNSSGSDIGAAYLFSGTTGDLLATYLRSQPEVDDAFGWSVAIGGSRAFVGAYSVTTNAPDVGAVFMFEIPVPEPSSLVLFILASGTLSGRRFIRHRICR